MRGKGFHEGQGSADELYGVPKQRQRAWCGGDRGYHVRQLLLICLKTVGREPNHPRPQQVDDSDVRTMHSANMFPADGRWWIGGAQAECHYPTFITTAEGPTYERTADDRSGRG
ncbi:hypothetical protein GCM10027167_71610 [Nocardia heshunensis]